MSGHRPLEGRRTRLIAAAAILATGLATHLSVPADAAAIGRKKAERIALRALKPPRKGAGRRVTVAIFGLRAPLGARSTVAEGGPPANAKRSVRTVRRLPRLGKPAWLFWRDSRYGAMFSHPSVLLLVDDRTGRVRRRRRLDWWPLIDGRQPPFLRNSRAYASKRYMVYSDLQLAGGRARPSARPAPRARASAPPPEVFAKDCLLSLYNRDDKRFLANVEAMERVANGAGIRAFRVKGRNSKFDAADATDLRMATGEAVEKGCKDILLYIAAHGDQAGTVLTGERMVFRKDAGGKRKIAWEDALITGAQITRAIADQVQNATFKVKVDTCYAGQQLPLLNLPNVLIVETASAANESAYFYLPKTLKQAERGRFYVLKNERNPEKLSEFTNRNVVGLQRFFERPEEIQHGLQQTQAQNTSFLAWGLSRAFLLGENADFASTIGWTDPQVRTQFAASAPNLAGR